jgi:hypothetical protein
VPLPDPAKAKKLQPKPPIYPLASTRDAEALTLAALGGSSVKLHADHKTQESTLGLGMDVAFDDQAR